MLAFIHSLLALAAPSDQRRKRSGTGKSIFSRLPTLWDTAITPWHLPELPLVSKLSPLGCKESHRPLGVRIPKDD